MKIHRILLMLAALLALSCGPKKASQPSLRSFPMVEVPLMITEPSQRIQWLGAHFWDRFTDTLTLYHCDSLTVNGVKKEDLEKQMGIFATLLRDVSLAEGQKDMDHLYSRLESFQLAHPASNLFRQMADITALYFYDPNSPVRSEDLYLPFVSRMAQSPLLEPAWRTRYEWEARMCGMNRIGTPAADFTFIDTRGRSRTLYQVKAEYTLLIFGNPDCHACKELMEAMTDSDLVYELLKSGRLQVVDIYIDQDIALWKERMEAYPKEWINGYDPTFAIRNDVLYSVRALPSLYLLDQAKTVLLKDAQPEEVLDFLLNL